MIEPRDLRGYAFPRIALERRLARGGAERGAALVFARERQDLAREPRRLGRVAQHALDAVLDVFAQAGDVRRDDRLAEAHREQERAALVDVRIRKHDDVGHPQQRRQLVIGREARAQADAGLRLVAFDRRIELARELGRRVSRDHQEQLVGLRQQLEGFEQAIHALVAPDQTEEQDHARVLRNVEAAATGGAGVGRMVRDEALVVSVRREQDLLGCDAEIRRQAIARVGAQHVDAIGERVPTREERPMPIARLVGHGVVRRHHQPAQQRAQQEIDRRFERRHTKRLHVDAVPAMAPQLPREACDSAQLAQELAQSALPSAEAGQHRVQTLAVGGHQTRVFDRNDAEPRVARERTHELDAKGVSAREALDQQHARARVHPAPQPGSRPCARRRASIQRYVCSSPRSRLVVGTQPSTCRSFVLSLLRPRTPCGLLVS